MRALLFAPLRAGSRTVPDTGGGLFLWRIGGNFARGPKALFQGILIAQYFDHTRKVRVPTGTS